MADTLTTKKVTELTENTAMSDEDLFMVGSAGTASLRKLKWSNIWNTIKTAILGKLVANNLTTTAAGYLLDARQGKALDDKISKLNTDLKQGGIRFMSPNEIDAIIPNSADYSHALKIFWVNGWDSSLIGLTPQPNAADFWLVLHIPAYLGVTNPANDMSFIKQIWMSILSNALYTRTYTASSGWKDFAQK